MFWTIMVSLFACDSGLQTYESDSDLPLGLDEASETDEDTDTDLGEPIDDDTGEAPPQNSAPTADAGPDQSTDAGQVIRLDGSASTDPDGDLLTYSWTFAAKPPGSIATLINDTRVDPEFWADRSGIFEVTLEVDDGEFVDSDTVTIEVASGNLPPIANAGNDVTVTVGTPVTLNGTGSFDPDNDTLSYTWSVSSKPTGSTAALVGNFSTSPLITPDLSGTYLIELVVNDGQSDSQPDSVRITAQSSGSGGGGDCDLSCAAANAQLANRLAQGDLTAVPGLAFFPVLIGGFLWRRRQTVTT